MFLCHEFVTFALKEGANFSELCRRHEISREIGYKWLRRFRQESGLGWKIVRGDRTLRLGARRKR